MTLRRRPGRPGQGVEGTSALCQPSYGPLPACRPAPCCVWVARRNARPWHRESRVHVLRAPRPPATLSPARPLHGRPPPPGLAVSPQTKIAPPGLCAGGAIASLPGCGKGSSAHGASPPGTPTLVVLPSRLPSCPGRRMPPRPKPVHAPGSLPHPPNGRTSAPHRPAHVGHAAGDAKIASCRGFPASLSSERACIGACRRFEGRAGGTDPPETRNRAADVLPEPGLRDPLRGPWRARGRGGRWNIGTRLP
jgi:hypothetical protein